MQQSSTCHNPILLSFPPPISSNTRTHTYTHRQAAQPMPRHSEEEEEGAKKEEGGEEESEESLKKAREWDDFKDENRRGWGNKRNMG